MAEPITAPMPFYITNQAGVPLPGFGGTVLSELVFNDSATPLVVVATIPVGQQGFITADGTGTNALLAFPGASGYGFALVQLELKVAQTGGLQAATRLLVYAYLENGDNDLSNVYASFAVADLPLQTALTTQYITAAAMIPVATTTSANLKCRLEIQTTIVAAVNPIVVTATCIPLKGSRVYVPA